MSHTDLSEELRNELSSLLDSYAENSDTMRADEVQAFVTAWVSGPDDYHVSQWIPEVTGNADFSAETVSKLETLLGKLAESLAAAFVDGTPPALWLYRDENNEPDYYTWSNAYLYALDTTPSDWFTRADNEDFEDLFFPLMVLAGVYDDEENDVGMNISDSEYQNLCDTLPETLNDIAAFWRAVRNKPQTVRREGAKVGRNDPCPCGSGKKYKACCAR